MLDGVPGGGPEVRPSANNRPQPSTSSRNGEASTESADNQSRQDESATNSNRARLPPNKPTVNDFLFGKLLGEGSFSCVYLAKDVRTQKEYASEYDVHYYYARMQVFDHAIHHTILN